MRPMKTFSALLALSVIAALPGCATKKDFYATGGSRADGTVDMAYDFRPFEQPVVDHVQAQRVAKSKCGVWGYSNAEPFGGKTTNCYSRDGWGNCTAGQIIVKYQCIGNLDAPAAKSTASPLPASNLAPGNMSKSQWQQQQLQMLMNDTTLNYEEYTRRREQILAE
ncbi:YecR family lipoprotein [Pseudomonas benzenivorans]|uniref:YecR family lipoprotein n=1 Tax=Pseudomonas benzenivorans TaxID=556533 RepID=A0ABZ0Q1T8_9PSED|nr:YecR family lipoprotein [Pseudomonas benzenivorans]WPC06941.1 YecR family lipoprotein [Pseudomonas benzenivorans]